MNKQFKHSKSKQISKPKTKAGLDTAKRMRDKIKSTQQESEEESDLEFKAKSALRKDGAVTSDLVHQDPFFNQDETETAEEKRLRITKKLIKELGEETKTNDDFFMGL